MPILQEQTLGDCLAYESLDTLTSAKGFTATYLSLSTAGYLPMKNAIVTCETASVRIRTDGTAPTTAEGQYLQQGGNYTVSGLNACKNFLAINANSETGAVLKCAYYY